MEARFGYTNLVLPRDPPTQGVGGEVADAALSKVCTHFKTRPLHLGDVGPHTFQ